MDSRNELFKAQLPTATSSSLMAAKGGGEGDLALEYEKFFQAVSCSPSSVVITNADGVIEYVNDRFVASTGYSRDQAVGRKPNLLKSGKTPAHVYDELWATITAGEIWRGEMCNLRRNGEHYWEATAIAPIFDEDGKPSHFVAVKDDITERRVAEAELQASQERDGVLTRVMHTLLGEVSQTSITSALQALAECLGAHRAFLFRLATDGQAIADSYEWVGAGVQSQRRGFTGLPCADFAWCLDRAHKGETVIIEDVAALPKAAETFKDLLSQGGIHANLTAPILQGGQFLGFVGVDMENGPRPWSVGEVEITERIAGILGLSLLRQDAENELRAARDLAHLAEQNLCDAIESMPEGFVLYDEAGNLKICNNRFRQDYGYSEDDVRLGTHFTDLGRLDITRGRVVVPEGYKDDDVYLENRLAYRTKLEGTFPVKLSDGRHLMTRDRRTSSGGLVSIQTDITRIMKTEEALRISERKFWGVFHASPSPMAIAGLEDGRFLDVNAKWAGIMGFDYTEVIGHTAMELGVWASKQAYARMVAAFTDDGILTDHEGQMKTRTGEVRDFLMSGALVSIDGAEHLLLVSHDITERKSMERDLKRSEREVRTILDNIVETFYRTDGEGMVVMISAAVQSLLGFDADELIGKSVGDYYVVPEERENFLKAVTDGGGRVSDFEARMKRRDGSIIWVSTNAQFIYDRDDNVVGVEGTTRDITAQREAERALLLAKEEAERANAAKSEFLSGMSHELRTPLNAVIGFSQMLEIQKDAGLSAQQHEYLGIIRSSGEHLLCLINEVLDLARVEAGHMEVRAVHVEPKSLVADCIALVMPMAVGRHIHIDSLGPDQPPHIMVDRTKFKQILINLLSNAVKYNAHGGSIAVRVAQEGDATLAISVTDTGKGMTPEGCNALFEPFQRLGAEHGSVEGTGLGLVLAKRMVEAMGGSIRVESAPGLGSTFTLAVPIAVS